MLMELCLNFVICSGRLKFVEFSSHFFVVLAQIYWNFLH